jgi:hypothetical protein
VTRADEPMDLFVNVVGDRLVNPKLPRNSCLACGKEVDRLGGIYCNRVCQGDYSYQTMVALWREGKITICHKGGGIRNWFRRYVIEVRGEKCEKCGWCERNPVTNKVPLELHHMGGKWQDSSPENLQVLCPNCHALTPTFRGLNRGKGRNLRRVGSAATALVL